MSTMRDQRLPAAIAAIIKISKDAGNKEGTDATTTIKASDPPAAAATDPSGRNCSEVSATAFPAPRTAPSTTGGKNTCASKIPSRPSLKATCSAGASDHIKATQPRVAGLRVMAPDPIHAVRAAAGMDKMIS